MLTIAGGIILGFVGIAVLARLVGSKPSPEEYRRFADRLDKKINK